MFLKAAYCYIYTHSQMVTLFYWFSQLLKPGVTLPQYGHVFPAIIWQYVKEPQSLPAHQDSTGLVAHFFAGLWVVPGDVIREACDVEDFRTHQGAVKHSHIPRYRENPRKLELVVDAILWKAQTSVENLFCHVIRLSTLIELGANWWMSNQGLEKSLNTRAEKHNSDEPLSPKYHCKSKQGC